MRDYPNVRLGRMRRASAVQTSPFVILATVDAFRASSSHTLRATATKCAHLARTPCQDPLACRLVGSAQRRMTTLSVFKFIAAPEQMAMLGTAIACYFPNQLRCQCLLWCIDNYGVWPRYVRLVKSGLGIRANFVVPDITIQCLRALIYVHHARRGIQRTAAR
jgi:hypothetical protein